MLETWWVGACDMADESNIAIFLDFDEEDELLADFRGDMGFSIVSIDFIVYSDVLY
jgi:hypothetical protein